MSSINLTHHFLIAMPNMADPYFAKTLTYICEHNDQGALGLVVNRPIDMTLQALFERLSHRRGAGRNQLRHAGGRAAAGGDGAPWPRLREAAGRSWTCLSGTAAPPSAPRVPYWPSISV